MFNGFSCFRYTYPRRESFRKNILRFFENHFDLFFMSIWHFNNNMIFQFFIYTNFGLYAIFRTEY